VCRSTKAAISLIRVKIEEKLLPIGTHQRFFERFHPRPLRPSLPEHCALKPPPLQSITIRPISGVGKGTNFKFCTHSHGIDRNKSPVKISGKLVVGVAMQGLPKILRAPIGYRAHRAVIFAIARLSCLEHGVECRLQNVLVINGIKRTDKLITNFCLTVNL